MAGWSGSGAFTRLYSWIADAAAGIDISSIRTDADTDLIVTQGFGNVLTRDGQGSATANLPMNGFRHTGASNAVDPQDYVTLDQFGGSAYVQGAFLGEIKTTSLPESLIASLMPGWHPCGGGTRPRTDPLWLATGAVSAGDWAFGNGDGSTTYTLPDQRGRVAVGKDNLGGTAASRITVGVSGLAGATLGAAGGSQLAQADTITLGGSVTASSTSTSTPAEGSGHLHNIVNPITNTFGTGGVALSGSAGGVGISSSYNTDRAVTGITVATTTTTTITDTKTAASSLTGSTQNVPPALVVNYVIFCGA